MYLRHSFILIALFLSALAVPAVAQTPVTAADLQRLQENVTEISGSISAVRSRDAQLASSLQKRLDDLSDEIIYLKVKLRKESSATRGEYIDLLDRIDRLRSEARNPPAPVPDGAMMVKEMYPPPGAACRGIDPDLLKPTKGAAVMVRDPNGSFDGWFWGWFGWSDQDWKPDWPAALANPYPNMGFGQYCTNCHASAQDSSTFAALKNIRGEPGTPLTFLSQHWFLDQFTPVDLRFADLSGHSRPAERNRVDAGMRSPAPFRSSTPLRATMPVGPGFDDNARSQSPRLLDPADTHNLNHRFAARALALRGVHLNRRARLPRAASWWRARRQFDDHAHAYRCAPPGRNPGGGAEGQPD